MTTIGARRALVPGGWIDDVVVEIDRGVIAAIRPSRSVQPDRILAPGFVDLQVNGIDDVDVATADGADWERLDQLLLAQGVTTWCPTLVTMPLGAYAAPLSRISAAMSRPQARRPALAGVHLEGPFLGGAPGAHPPGLIAPIDLEWLRSLPGHVAVVTLAPEQPLATEAVELLTRRDVLVALGHTTATEQQFDAAVAAGAQLTTHLFNGMSGVHHRTPGVAVFAITHPDVAASIIADGVHVHPRVLRLAFQALGPARAVLVTDAVGWRAPSLVGLDITLRDGAPRLADGTLAGSAAPMDHCIRTCVAAGVDLADALRAASTNPARLLGLADRGEIEVGRRADLVALTPDAEVEQVWTGVTG